MNKPLSKPTVKLIGQDWNAFGIMGRVKQALKSAGADKEYIGRYLSEATSADYDHLLTVSMDFVNVEWKEFDWALRSMVKNGFLNDLNAVINGFRSW